MARRAGILAGLAVLVAALGAAAPAGEVERLAMARGALGR